jgi:oligoendopeptidase F
MPPIKAKQKAKARKKAGATPKPKAKRKLTGAENVRWDTGLLYGGIDDPQLETDIKDVEARAKKLRADYRGKLATLLGSAIRDLIAMNELQDKVGTYLMLMFSTDTSNAAVKAKKAEAERRLSYVSGEYLAFFDIELAKLTDKQVDALASGDETVAKHLPFLKKVRMFKPHMLPEKVESALDKRSPFGPHAWHELYEEVESDLRFDWQGVKKTLTEMFKILEVEKDLTVRAAALKTVNDGLGGMFAKFSAETLYVTAGAKRLEGRERKYPHPMAARNMSNWVDDKVVEALHAAVNASAPGLTARHYSLKARLMGLSLPMRWSDRNAPMPFADTSTVPYGEAERIVLATFDSFSTRMEAIAAKIIERRLVDAPTGPTKRSGAYSASLILPGGAPLTYILLNYQGTSGDAMTFAHEMGHSVHGILGGRRNSILQFHAPICFAETASVFAETVCFEHLLKRLEAKGDLKSMLSLTIDRGDDMMNTIVRQIGFSNFERFLHGTDRKLSVEDLSKSWHDRLVEHYGEDGKVFDYADTDLLWSYIPHFHSPFYVYGYAFGLLVTGGIMAQRERLGKKFEPLYVDMLSAGGTRDAVAMLEPFGIDPRQPDFWSQCIEHTIGRLVDKEEELAARLNRK